MPPLAVAAIGVGGSLLASRSASKAAKRAASTQAAAADRASQIQLQLAEQQRADFAPFRELGTQNIQSLQDLVQRGGVEDVEATPAFQFRSEQARKSIDRALAARGGFDSSAALTTLAQEQSRIAGEEESSQFNRRFGTLLDLVNIGKGATTTAGTSAGQTSRNLSDIALGRGEAVAGGQLAAGEQRASTFSNLGALPLQTLTAFPDLLKKTPTVNQPILV